MEECVDTHLRFLWSSELQERQLLLTSLTWVCLTFQSLDEQRRISAEEGRGREDDGCKWRGAS